MIDFLSRKFHLVIRRLLQMNENKMFSLVYVLTDAFPTIQLVP